ncbi:hypothetical protein EYF80_026067 [Liparis tanakae]|uniref:Uncharacterized protein n=1 Tax=Liparis tanakae TaxID=230148 RepID=A0A4Z2HDY1_9TELE|nr:hypothetical protein EYF80_026067 [Liparis tanakae]
MSPWPGTVICSERPDGPLHTSRCSLDTVGHVTDSEQHQSLRKGGGAGDRRRSSSRHRRSKLDNEAPSAGYHSEGRQACLCSSGSGAPGPQGREEATGWTSTCVCSNSTYTGYFMMIFDHALPPVHEQFR